MDRYSGESVQIQDGDSKTDVIVIGSLNDPKLAEHVRDFILEVAQIKGLINNKPFISSFLEKMFSKVFLELEQKNIPVKGSKLSQIFIDFRNDLKEFANNLSL